MLWHPVVMTDAVGAEVGQYLLHTVPIDVGTDVGTYVGFVRNMVGCRVTGLIDGLAGLVGVGR